ncbi:Uncharacterised protein [Moraxella lacunata]|uniref:DUF6984 domain-containing protein n=2 Tax=Moraxella lacunata TaxID=477 RepID=A0A1V4GYR0_MORLA|nr:hypothetical protein [Moraxella lacunata]OPH37747.1 hypothetical protein B5J94_05150 [Moraxella lacunata]STZ74887.1 Uncharacterised protein [Moraxella lacunata]
MLKDDIKLRFLRESELLLISKLLDLCTASYKLQSSLKQILVFDLTDDGGMGSLEFFYDSDCVREFDKPLIQAETYDTDGRKIMLELSLDNYGYLYQLDSWTSDFNPLVSPLGTLNILENIKLEF